MLKEIRKGDQVYKMGRQQPDKPASDHLSFHRYLKKQSLPTPPASTNYSSYAVAVLADILLNGTLGDCVIAGGYHNLGVFTGGAGNAFHANSAQITADYSAIGGYVPGVPSTDQGCDEQTALNYWTTHGFANGDKLSGWLAVDASNKTLLMQAIDLFENAFFGVCLPDAWVANEPQASGFVWDVAGPPDPNNGHCVVAVGYNEQGVIIATWGMIGTITWAAIAKYMVPSAGGDAYILISEDMLIQAQEKSPEGFDWSQLVADFDAIGGNLPVPPEPTPTPPPAPPNPIPPYPPSPYSVADQKALSYAANVNPDPVIRDLMRYLIQSPDHIFALQYAAKNNTDVEIIHLCQIGLATMLECIG